MTPLARWESISLRVDGAKVNQLVRERLGPHIKLTFERARVKVTVALISVEITSIDAQGNALLVVVKKPPLVPAFLIEKGWSFLRDYLPRDIPRDAVTLRPPSTFVIQVDRFLPPVVAVEIRSVRIIEGGLAVELGAGGITIGRNHGRDE
jgi:hypothetical protein